MNLSFFERFKGLSWIGSLRLNKILTILLVSDVLIISGFGLISPIFAVFLTSQISGGSLVVVGIAEAIFLATKSIFQIPVGLLIDKTKGEKVDFNFVFLGSIIMSLSVLLYLVADSPLHIYFIQFVYGIGAAMSFPAWMGLFTRNMDEGKESYAWSIASTPSELGAALTAALGGILADRLGFSAVFLVVGIISLLGSLLLLIIRPYIKKE